VEFYSAAQKIESRPFIPPDEYKKANPDDDQKKILKLIERKGEISTGECESVVGKSKPTVIAKINDLVAKKLLETTTSSSHDPKTKYRLHARFSRKELISRNNEETSQQEKLL
jgi:predicted HTH transcriptional regulator